MKLRTKTPPKFTLTMTNVQAALLDDILDFFQSSYREGSGPSTYRTRSRNAFAAELREVMEQNDQIDLADPRRHDYHPE